MRQPMSIRVVDRRGETPDFDDLGVVDEHVEPTSASRRPFGALIRARMAAPPGCGSRASRAPAARRGVGSSSSLSCSLAASIRTASPVSRQGAQSRVGVGPDHEAVDHQAAVGPVQRGVQDRSRRCRWAGCRVWARAASCRERRWHLTWTDDEPEDSATGIWSGSSGQEAVGGGRWTVAGRAGPGRMRPPDRGELARRGVEDRSSRGGPGSRSWRAPARR